MDTYTKAMGMLKRLDFSLRPLRLGKYFSSREIIAQFNRSASLFLVPKKNLCRIKVWRDILGRIVVSPVDFLRQYFKRNLSECGFSADKGRFSSIIKQRRDDR